MFTEPELGRVALNETQARRSGVAYRVAKVPMAEWQPVSVHAQDGLWNLKRQLRPLGRRLGAHVLIHREVVFAEQGDRPESDLPLRCRQQRLPIVSDDGLPSAVW